MGNIDVIYRGTDPPQKVPTCSMLPRQVSSGLDSLVLGEAGITSHPWASNVFDDIENSKSLCENS